MIDYLPVFLLIFILAAFLKEDAVMAIFYLLGGIYLVGAYWSHAALRNVSFQRSYTRRVFLHETLTVRVRMQNKGWLPVVWLQLFESLPVELGAATAYQAALSLSSHGHSEFEYRIYAQKRGYYRIGPLFMRSGDLLGLSEDREIAGETDFLIVYPRIVAISHFPIPSRIPFGSIRHSLPIHEDPSRVIGKRGYQSGDSIRRIDWKSTASSGSLQVKQFGSSIALESIICLNLDRSDYDLHSIYSTTEIGIVAAASIANWVVTQKQAVGLFTNGSDPLEANQIARPISARKGRNYLMRVLDLLARVQVSSNLPFLEQVNEHIQNLPWGTTVILITPKVSDAFFDLAFTMQRKGLNPALVLIGSTPLAREVERKARQFRLPFHYLSKELDLDAW